MNPLISHLSCCPSLFASQSAQTCLTLTWNAAKLLMRGNGAAPNCLRMTFHGE